MLHRHAMNLFISLVFILTLLGGIALGISVRISNAASAAHTITAHHLLAVDDPPPGH